MKTLALIPARSGSKGIPGKNVREFAGQPLMAWAIRIGLRCCAKTFVTTNDYSYGHLGAQYGAGILLSDKHSDTSAMLTIVQDALEQLKGSFEPDVVVLLQPTSPLRTVAQVLDGLSMLTDDYDSVVSVVPAPSPDLIATVENDRLIVNEVVTRRQDARPGWKRDGTFYITRAECIEQGSLYGDCKPYFMPADSSVTIDTEADWKQAEQIMAELEAQRRAVYEWHQRTKSC